MMELSNTPLRKYSHKKILEQALPLRTMLGISRLTSVGEFINIPGISVVNAVRTRLKKGQVSSTQGKGRSLKTATSSALMEAYERHCACWCDEAVFQWQVGLKEKLTLNRLGYRADCEVNDWMLAKEWNSDHEILLPAIEIQFPYIGPDLQGSNVRSHTSGLAAGATVPEASCFAVMECLERNITSHFFKKCISEVCGDLINFDSITDSRILNLYHNLKYNGYQCFALRIHSRLPTYYVALYDPVNMGPKFMVAGTASGFSEVDALDSALMEAIQGLVVSLQASREDLKRQQVKYESQSYFGMSKFSKLNTLFRERYNEIDMPETEVSVVSLNSGMTFLSSILREQGHKDIYIADLSLSDTPFSTVKAVIPGVFDNHVNPNRI